MTTLALLRHGESVWNRERRFAGWADVELSARGRAEAERAGRLLAARGIGFEMCFTSRLRRAAETLRIVLATMQARVAVRESWRLNERHCGAFEGLTVGTAVRRYGLRRVLAWQLRAGAPPPALDHGDVRVPEWDTRYAGGGTQFPRAESLEDLRARVVSYWQKAIVPELKRGTCTLIVAHRNTLRVIAGRLGGATRHGVPRVRIATGAVLLYELDESMWPSRRELLR